MENADISNCCPEMLRVGSQFTDGRRSGMIQGVIQNLLIAVNDGTQDIRYCKYQMKVRGIQDIFPTGIHPHFFWNSLTHGTATVPAGIMMNLGTTTVLIYADIHSISTCFTIHDVPGGPGLLRKGGYICQGMQDKTGGRYPVQ